MPVMVSFTANGSCPGEASVPCATAAAGDAAASTTPRAAATVVATVVARRRRRTGTPQVGHGGRRPDPTCTVGDSEPLRAVGAAVEIGCPRTAVRADWCA